MKKSKKMSRMKKIMTSAIAAALLFAAGATNVFADSQYVNEDKVYSKIDGKTVYISSDNFLYNFSGEIPGVTICGYEGKKTDLVIPEEINGRAVSAIDDDSFAENDEITSLVVPPSVISIGEGSFNGCTRLENITLSGGVSVLSDVFSDCPRLKSISFPYGVTEINNSFRNCTALTSVKFSRSVSRLGDGSFNGCSSIEKIEWSTGLSYLGDVFDGCKMLSTIHIPKGIVTIDGAFDNCTFAEVLELPDSVLYINSGFSNCAALRSMKMPGGLVYIGNAFGNCTSLANIEIPPSTELDGAFENCPNINVMQQTDSPKFVVVTIVTALFLCGMGYAVYKNLNTLPKEA